MNQANLLSNLFSATHADGGKLITGGNTVPSGDSGYHVNCLFCHLDGSGVADAWYVNTGTLASCTFTAITSSSTVTGITGDTLTIASGQTDGTFVLSVNTTGTNHAVTLKAPITSQAVTMTLPDYAAGTLVAINAGQVLNTITDLTNVQHDHSNTANGGAITATGLTGTTEATWEVNSDGNALVLSSSGLSQESTFTFPDQASGVISVINATETLTNKTLTSPTISGGTLNNAAIGGGTPAAGAFTTVSSTGAATLASLVCTAAGTFGGGYGAAGCTISTAGVGQFNGALTTDGALTADNIVCTNAATFGSGYGSTGVTISTAGAISADAAITGDTVVIEATSAHLTLSGATNNAIITCSDQANQDNTYTIPDVDGNDSFCMLTASQALTNKTLTAATAGTTLTFADACNIVINTTTGTKIGTGATQKIGFWNATPVVQPSHVADPAACASMTFSAGSIDTGTDMTSGEATQIVNDLAALKAAADANNAALDSILAQLATIGLQAAS